jgi:hypothetical protein
MSREGDRDYFRARAEAELLSAREAKTPEAQRAHSLLAGYYFDRAFGETDTTGYSPPHEADPPPQVISNDILA